LVFPRKRRISKENEVGVKVWRRDSQRDRIDIESTSISLVQLRLHPVLIAVIVGRRIVEEVRIIDTLDVRESERNSTGLICVVEYVNVFLNGIIAVEA
jgi:hypothetical protein